MSKFKIFYSWQSDLPGNKTRNFIRECIDKAIVDLASDSEAIEAERDEATKGLTGSPDIVASLFSKIDDCDLFVADLSLCFKETSQGLKKSPNPNVLLELGYAVKTLGWERVICLCNTDFGEDYPFDIEHNRITKYALEGKVRKEVRHEISEILSDNIRSLKNQPPRPKPGSAVHILGSYDFECKKVIAGIVPLDLSKAEGFALHNEELLQEAKALFEQIQELTDKMKASAGNIPTKEKSSDEGEYSAGDVSAQRQVTEDATKRPNELYITAQKQILDLYKGSAIPAVHKDKEKDIELIKKWLDTEVQDDFFDLGGLVKMVQFLNMNDPILDGTDYEIKKKEKLDDLSYKLTTLEVRSKYIKTFEGMCYIPLAIQNISSLLDNDISILVVVDTGEIVDPEKNLICSDLEGIQGLLCRDDDEENDVGIICELFAPDEDGIVHIENASYDPSSYIPKIPVYNEYGFSQPDKTEEDYKNELEEFIASSHGLGYYEFEVKSLRPNECKWLSYGMLIRPDNGVVKVQYTIKSAHSFGDIEGELEFNADKSISL